MIDEDLTFNAHHKQEAGKALTAVSRARSIIKSCNYQTKQMVLSTYILPLQDNTTIVAASNLVTIEICSRFMKKFLGTSLLKQKWARKSSWPTWQTAYVSSMIKDGSTNSSLASWTASIGASMSSPLSPCWIVEAVYYENISTHVTCS